MLFNKPDWVEIAEVNPPLLPDMTHLRLEGAWENVLVTDNIFGKIRVSPYAFAARITHDLPAVHPTVVVSSRDRNILAIESEVRGALGNGVDSFLVVTGDSFGTIDHLSNHDEVVQHLVGLQTAMPAFEVGMPIQFRRKQLELRQELGAQFFITTPILDPETVEGSLERLRLEAHEPPVFLAVMPPFSPPFVDRAERFGAVPVTEALKRRLADSADQRRFGWGSVRAAAERARGTGCAGVVLMGLRFETVVDESPAAWRGEG